MSRTVEEIKREAKTGYMMINVLDLKERCLMPTEVRDGYNTRLSEIGRLNARLGKAEAIFTHIVRQHLKSGIPKCFCSSCEKIADYRKETS